MCDERWCVKERLCVCVRVIILNKHVCVGNVWIDAKLLFCLIYKSISRGTGADLPSQSTKAMAFRWMSGLINHLYLLFYWLWHGAKPKTPHTHTAGLPQSGFFVVLRLYLFNFIPNFVWALQFNIQNSGHGWLMETSGQGFGIANFVIPHYYSRDYFTSWWTPLTLYCMWFCMHGIQFPTDPIKDPFLV